MKIIERGATDRERETTGRFRCLHCKTVIETDAGDLDKWTYVDASGEPYGASYWEIPCPVCKRDICSLWVVEEARDG